MADNNFSISVNVWCENCGGSVDSRVDGIYVVDGKIEVSVYANTLRTGCHSRCRRFPKGHKRPLYYDEDACRREDERRKIKIEKRLKERRSKICKDTLTKKEV